MKKALSVTIGGIVFTIEEDAFHELDSYLKQVRGFFSKNEDHDEIIADIEAGIADKFKQSLRQGKQAVTHEDVKNAIHEMGTVNDFKENVETDEKEEQSFFEKRTSGKKLFRDTDNKILEGVCAGLANYFAVDPTFVRILFIVLIFTPLAAISIIGYLVLWAIMPPTRTRIDRMKMSGEEITLNSFSNEEKEEEPKKKEGTSLLERIVAIPFRILGAMFRFVGKLIPFCIDICVGFSIFGAVVGAIIVSIMAGVFVLFRNRFVFDGPLSHFPASATDYLFIGATYFAMIFTVVYLIILGISVLKRKYIINGWVTAVIAVCWFVSVITCGIFGTGVGIRVRQEYTNMPVREKTMTPDVQFSTITVDTGIEKFDVVYGAKQQVTVSGVQNDINRVSVHTGDKGELLVTELLPRKHCLFCGYRGDVRVKIETPYLSSLMVNSPVHGDIEGSVLAPESNFILANSAHVTVTDLNGKQVYAVTQTGARLTLKGKAEKITARVLDSSFLEAQELSVNEADIDVVDEGKAYVDAVSFLKGKTGEYGTIYYVANPVIESSASASIKQMIRGEILPD